MSVDVVRIFMGHHENQLSLECSRKERLDRFRAFGKTDQPSSSSGRAQLVAGVPECIHQIHRHADERIIVKLKGERIRNGRIDVIEVKRWMAYV